MPACEPAVCTTTGSLQPCPHRQAGNTHSLCEQQVVAARGIQVATTACEHHGPCADQGAGDRGGRQVPPAELSQAWDEAEVHQRAYGRAELVAAELALRKVPGV